MDSDSTGKARPMGTNVLMQAVDWIFGCDFFIFYGHADGPTVGNQQLARVMIKMKRHAEARKAADKFHLSGSGTRKGRSDEYEAATGT